MNNSISEVNVRIDTVVYKDGEFVAGDNSPIEEEFHFTLPATHLSDYAIDKILDVVRKHLQSIGVALDK